MKHLIALCLAFFGTQAAVAKPGIDCVKTANKAEKLVCRDGELSQAEKKLVSLYLELKAGEKGIGFLSLKRDQIAWMKKRGRCAKVAGEKAMKSCLSAEYAARMRILELSKQVKVLAAFESRLQKHVLESAYRDEKLGFELKFPGFLKASKNFTGGYLIRTGSWSEFSPPVNGADHAEPLVEVEIQPGVILRVGAFQGPAAPLACKVVGTNPHSEAVGTRAFNVSELHSEGAKQFGEGKSFKILHKGTCFAVESLVWGSEYSGKEDQAWVKRLNDQKRELRKSSETFARSFRLLSD